MRAMKNQITTMRTKMKNNFETSMAKQHNEQKNMMTSFIQMHSPSGSGMITGGDKGQGAIYKFKKMARALIDVHGDELTLRVNDKAITFKVEHTSRYSHNYYEKSVNQINVIDVACKEYAQEVLGFLNSSTSGNLTPSDPIISASSPSFTLFEGSDFILEEIETFLRTPDELSTLDDDFDLEGDIALIEKLLNKDPSLNLPLM
uniref:Reverse transcriptase domain-containing protein n=1 Tax=Tanacetum cinerariifolium TaxID=118510 RepID=A0A699KTV3_TANCI|nr:reverse transcriptase domain-containing protein [Tanacetum cinerariifolium]